MVVEFVLRGCHHLFAPHRTKQDSCQLLKLATIHRLGFLGITGALRMRTTTVQDLNPVPLNEA